MFTMIVGLGISSPTSLDFWVPPTRGFKNGKLQLPCRIDHLITYMMPTLNRRKSCWNSRGVGRRMPAVPRKFWKGIRWPLIYIEVFSLDFIMLFTSKLNVTFATSSFLLCVPNCGIYLAWRHGQNIRTHCPLQQHMRISDTHPNKDSMSQLVIGW